MTKPANAPGGIRSKPQSVRKLTKKGWMTPQTAEKILRFVILPALVICVMYAYLRHQAGTVLGQRVLALWGS